MKAFWAFTLDNPTLLFVPAIGFVLSLAILRIKKKYVNEGILFGRSLSARCESERTRTVEAGEMIAENHIDLQIALRKIHELAMEDGDLGYEYWYEIGRLLKRANGMQAEIDALSKELERCRAMLPKTE
jgi:hypothetical protein